MADWSYLDGPNPSRQFPGATASDRMAAQLPGASRMVRGADGVLRAVGSFGAKAARVAGPAVGGALAVGGEAMGVAEVARDPNASGLDVATRVAEGTGRLASAGAGAGLGAAGGSVFGPVGTAIGATVGGTLGYFAPNAVYAARDWWQGRGANPAAPARPLVPAAPASEGQVLSPEAGGNAAARTTVPGMYEHGRAGGQAPFLPDADYTRGVMDRANDVMGGGAALPGTGAFRNTRTGAVSPVDTRGETGAVDTRSRADITGVTANGLPNIGGFFGATAGLRNIAQDNARKAAVAKAELQYGGTAEERRAKAQNEQLRTNAAQEHLRTHPGDYAGAATVAAGRALPGDSHVFLPTMDQNKVDVGDKRTGALERVTVQPKPTENDILADMKKIDPNTKKPYTREAVLAEYRRRGVQVGGFGATR